MKTLFYFFASATILFYSCASEQNQKRRWRAINSPDNFGGNTSGSRDNFKTEAYVKEGESNVDNTAVQDRMIVYNAELHLTVKRPDSTAKALSIIAKKYNGFAQTAGTSYAVLRVKSESLNQALNDIAKLGKVESKSIIARDETDNYFDTKIRMENARKAREKYLDLMQKAVNVQDMVAIEKELDRLNGEIDQYEGQMKRIENNVSLSTITIYIHERKQPGPIGYIFVGIYKVVKFLFVVN